MRIVVLGAGAMGSLVGGVLSEAHDVTLVGRDPHMEAVAKAGLRITGETDLLARPHAVTRARDAPVPELLVVTTKAYDTVGALRDASSVLGPSTLVLSLQNGLGNLESVREHVPATRALAGVTSHGVTHEAPGHVHHAGRGFLRLGSPRGPLEAATRVADAFREAGLDAEVSAAILGEIWAKVVVNAGINPVTAITGLRNGALLEEAGLRALLEDAAREAVAVAEAEGVALPDEDLVARTRQVAEATAANKSSMLQDVERGRRTEVDAICGEIVERGVAHGVPTPVVRTLAALVRGIELTTRR